MDEVIKHIIILYTVMKELILNLHTYKVFLLRTVIVGILVKITFLLFTQNYDLHEVLVLIRL